MKNRIQLLLSGLIFLCSVPSVAQSENDRLGNFKNVAIFKKSLVIPFEALRPDGEEPALRSTIEKSGVGTPDNYVAITIVDGEVIRMTDVFYSVNAVISADFNFVSKKRERSMPFGTVEEDISYCVLYINASKLQRDDAERRYVFSPRNEMIPYTEQLKSFNLNSGTITEERFGMFIELKPTERPNPITHVGRSNEISMLTCYRYAAKNQGLRAKDFVQILGKENIELRTK